MIAYSPTNGDPLTTPIEYRPRTCFIMTKLGEDVPQDIVEIRTSLNEILSLHKIKVIDASSQITGRDFLDKIWKMVLSVPFGISIVSENLNSQTLSNIFYEVGMLHSYGKEALIVKTKNSKVPSDFVRTEYITFDKNFETNIEKYLNDHLFKIAEGFELYSEQLERNPLLAIDYLKRSFLITGNQETKNKATKILRNLEGLEQRAKNSVELLMARF